MARDAAHIALVLSGGGAGGAYQVGVLPRPSDAEFCGRLVDLGRADVLADRERIAAFFARAGGVHEGHASHATPVRRVAR